MSTRKTVGLLIFLAAVALALLAAPAAAADPPACSGNSCNCPPGYYCCELDGSCWDPVANPGNCSFTKCGTGGTCNEKKVCKQGCSAPSHCKPTSNGDRTITFVNQCAERVRIGVNGGFIEEVSDCGQCPSGTSCLADRTPSPACFFDFPAPSSGSDVLAPAGQSGDQAVYKLDQPPRHVTVKTGPARHQQLFVKWSGNVYAATGCDAKGENCQTGMCPESVSGRARIVPCRSGVGPPGPVTLAEFTFSFDGTDYYDVSMVNGFNVPVSMKPASSSVHPKDPYWCQTPGSTAPTSQLQACSWSFQPTVNGADETTTLRVVTGGGAACTTDSDCQGGAVCGNAFQLGTLDVDRVCGTQIGWWNGNELCAFTNGGYGAPIDCGAAVPGQGKNDNLFQCNGANAQSCYQTTAGASCCGCPNWNINGHILPTAPGFSCYSNNPSWDSVSQPWALFTKQACPTAYSFAFDDATSTFTCETANPSCQNPNTMDYTITFCPGGQRGF